MLICLLNLQGNLPPLSRFPNRANFTFSTGKGMDVTTCPVFLCLF